MVTTCFTLWSMDLASSVSDHMLCIVVSLRIVKALNTEVHPEC